MLDGALASSEALIPASLVATITDPAAYADGRILDTYAWLRIHNPFGLAMAEGYDPFWVATRHADIQAISARQDLFHAGDRQNTFVDRDGDRFIRAMMGGSPHLVKSVVSMDPPLHAPYRALTQGWFMPANVRKLEARIREIARAAVDGMAARGGRCDFARDVALGYPLHVIMSILGVPAADEPIMLKLTQDLFGPKDPDITGAAAPLAAGGYAEFLMTTARGFNGYFRGLSAARRAHPTDDLATVIANATIDGAPIPEDEEFGYYITVATAGHDTTSSSTATAIWELAENPDEFAKVKADLSLIPTLVDEAIRWAAPIKSFMRSATRETTIAGRDLAAGDWIMLCYASGNRDAAVFEAPDRFKADRSPNRHLSFGHGAHNCLGQHLAKMEMRILFEELLPRLKSVALDGTPRRSKAWFISGPKALPIRFEMEA